MMGTKFGKQLAVFGLLALAVPLGTHDAQAARHGAGRYYAHAIRAGMSGARSQGYARYGRSGTLQCVPFARENTGIELTGNANTWWSSAQGVYDRGSRPEVGSVLTFRATGHMRLGHVAVVTNVVSSRSVEIDHANWGGPGAVSRNITVVDVSPANDWTAVRVGLGHSGDYGSVYPTYGFIYDRPDHGTMLANTGVPAAAPATVVAALATQPATAAAEPEEVAEAADDNAPLYAHRRTGRHGRIAAHARAYGHVQVYRAHTHASFEHRGGRRHRM